MDIYTVVNLNVTEDLSYKKFISERIHVGENLTVSCKYPDTLKNNSKFVSRRLQHAVCPYNISVEERGKYVNMGNFSQDDDRARQIFSVSIRNVTEQDSGEYWCGAEADWTSDHGYKVYITRINLTVTQINLKNQPEFPTSIVIIASVGLLVLLLVGLSVPLVFFGKIQGKASIDKCSVHSSGNNQEFMLLLNYPRSPQSLPKPFIPTQSSLQAPVILLFTLLLNYPQSLLFRMSTPQHSYPQISLIPQTVLLSSQLRNLL
ncbi:hypothetical protein QTP70_027748 [Hemibagrus guttatus]|uniref:Immunoglobulin domain-containing protein n=1 Tax=Hemibagrus guttatus TaxID=175788 RepID=A0AAE0VFU9_9TELE|nr:hypothetical protein QTP70_027748 [Hemibagrus guttatus]